MWHYMCKQLECMCLFVSRLFRHLYGGRATHAQHITFGCIRNHESTTTNKAFFGSRYKQSSRLARGIFLHICQASRLCSCCSRSRVLQLSVTLVVLLLYSSSCSVVVVVVVVV